MLKLSFDEVKDKVLENSSMSEDEFEEKVDSKLEELSGLISKEGAAHIIANEQDITLFDEDDSIKIKHISAGMRGVEIVGKVVKKYEVREFDTGDKKGQVGSFLLGDDSGIIRVVLWNDQADLMEDFSEDDVLEIDSAYAKENNNRVELHINSRSNIDINPEGVEVQVQSRPDKERKSISDLEEGDQNVEILATVVQVFDLRFYTACPKCNKRVREEEDFECPNHGEVDPAHNYVLNCFMDDGSDNLRCVFFRDQVRNLLDLDDEEIQEFRKDPDEFDEVKNDLLGNIVKVRGRVVLNDVVDRLELLARGVERNPDPDEEMSDSKGQKKLDEDNSKSESSGGEEEKEEKSEEGDDDLELDEVDLDDEEELLSLEDVD